MRLILSLTVILAGCASPKFEKRLDIDLELQHYVASFEFESKRYGRPVTVDNLIARFGSVKHLGDDVIAYCRPSKNPLIVIDEQFWRETGDGSREHTMFHELGHCLLGRGHDDSVTPVGYEFIPTSVMNTYIFDEDIYLKHRDYYLQELFYGQ